MDDNLQNFIIDTHYKNSIDTHNCYKCHLCDNIPNNFNISQFNILLPWCPKCYAKNLINVVRLGNNDKICHTCASFGKKTILIDDDMIPIGASSVTCLDCINKYGIEREKKIWKKYNPTDEHLFQKRINYYKTNNILYGKKQNIGNHIPQWNYYKDGHIYPLHKMNDYDNITNQLSFPVCKTFSLFQQYKHPQLRK